MRTFIAGFSEAYGATATPLDGRSAYLYTDSDVAPALRTAERWGRDDWERIHGHDDPHHLQGQQDHCLVQQCKPRAPPPPFIFFSVYLCLLDNPAL